MPKTSFIKNWKNLLQTKNFRISLILSLVMWIPSFIIYRICIEFVDGVGSVAVKDLLLNLLPVLDLQYIYVYGIVIIMGILFCYLIFAKPEQLPFALIFLSFIFICRAICMTLTHLAPPEGFLITSFSNNYNYWPLTHILHANDLFFSGHVGYPFAAALITQKNKKMFAFFLLSAMVMSFTVLVMRAHYSIDVVAAYFIVYGVYKICQWFFKKLKLYQPAF